MSDSENDLDYIEIVKTLNEKNLFLESQEQDTELRERYEESFKKYSEMRTAFFKMKDEFEINQIQMFKSNILLADSRNQLDTQLLKLEELEKKSQSLSRKSQEQQSNFEDSVKNWSDKINELSTRVDHDTQLLKIREGQSNVDFLLHEIGRIQENHKKEDNQRLGNHIIDDLKDVRRLTDELMNETKDYEEKIKNCNELEIEINEFEIIIEDIRKQLK